MGSVSHLPLRVKHTQKISFLKYSRYEITGKLKSHELYHLTRVKCVSVGGNDEYSLKINLHPSINLIIFPIQLNRGVESKNLLLFSPV